MLIPEMPEGSEKESAFSLGAQGRSSGKGDCTDSKTPRGGAYGSGKYFILRQM